MSSETVLVPVTDVQERGGRIITSSREVPLRNPRFAVTALIFDQYSGRVLTSARKHDPMDIGLPGGKVDLGETPEGAIVREVWEETRCVIECPTNQDIVTQQLDCEGYHTTCYRCVLKPCSIGRGLIQPKGEGQVRWARPDELVLDNCRFADFNRRAMLVAGIL